MMRPFGSARSGWAGTQRTGPGAGSGPGLTERIVMLVGAGYYRHGLTRRCR